MYPWGVPPRVSSRGPGSPRDLAPPIPFSERVGKTPRALEESHSSLFSVAVQDGGNSANDGIVFDACCDPVREPKDVVAPAHPTRLFAGPLPSLWLERTEGLGENAPVGPSSGPKSGQGSPSPKNGG